MVSYGRRAQLILAGALLLAAVIFGLSFLLNSLLYSGAVASGSTTATVSDTDRVNFEVQRGLRSLIVRVNHAKRNVDAPALADAVRANVTTFSRLYGESKISGSTTAVTVTYQNATSHFGARLIQAADGEFEPGDDLVDDAYVGWFTANLEFANTTVEPTEIEVENDSASVDYEIEKDGANISVTSDPSWMGATSDMCGATQGRVLLDFFDGSGFNSDCEFVGIGQLGGEIDEIEINEGEETVGRYSIVLDEQTDNFDDCDPGEPRDEVCVAPALWTANVTMQVVGQQVTYADAFNLSVYPRSGP